MPDTFDQMIGFNSDNTNTATSLPTTNGLTSVAKGDFIVVAIGLSSSQTITSVVDNLGTVYTQIALSNTVPVSAIYVGYCGGSAGINSQTITVNYTAGGSSGTLVGRYVNVLNKGTNNTSNSGTSTTASVSLAAKLSYNIGICAITYLSLTIQRINNGNFRDNGGMGVVGRLLLMDTVVVSGNILCSLGIPNVAWSAAMAEIPVNATLPSSFDMTPGSEVVWKVV